MGAVACFFLWYGAKKATSGVPGRWQAAVELLFEMVDSQARMNIHNEKSRKLIAPLALVVFVWVILMNAMDFLPVDLFFGLIIPIFGLENQIHYFRVVPTADVSITMGLSVSVLLLCLFYNVKIKGFGGWMHEMFTTPFGAHPVIMPLNFAFQLLEFVAKTLSHGVRLFGNMFAGELVFLLIAMLGWGAAASFSGFLLPIGQLIAGTVWAIFHILIVALQAFIFMTLTLVYLGQAHETH